jgi:predicted exporter
MRRAGWAGSVIFAVLALLALSVIARATYTADLSAFLPRAPTAQERLLVDELRTGLASRVIMVAVEGGSAAQRAVVAAGLARALRADPAFVAVSDGDSAGLEQTAAFLIAHRYLLSDAVTPERFTTAGLHAAIDDTLALLASPEGLAAKSLFTRDPTGETAHILEALGGWSLPTVNGVWSSRDGRRALLIAQTRAGGSDTDGQERACAAIARSFAAAAGAVPAAAGTLTLRMSGPGVFAVMARRLIRDSVIRLSGLGSFFIAVLLLTAYRSVPALLLTFVPVAAGALAGVAAVALGFGTVHGITLGFGVTLIGEAVDYSIYLFIQSDSVWPTIRLGMLTSVCGFAALLPSSFNGLAQLGCYSIAGLVAAALVARWVLPEWRPPKLRTHDLTGLGIRLWRGVSLLRPARAVLALIALCGGLVLFANRGALLSRELLDLSPIPEVQQQLDASLRADLGAPDPRYLVVASASDLDAALGAARAVSQQLAPLVAEGVIGSFETPTRYLPDPATQRARQESLPEPAQLAARLGEALEGLPVSEARLEPFLRDVEQARTAALVTPSDFAGTPLGAALDALLQSAGRDATAYLPISGPGGGDLSSAALERLRAAVAAATPAASLLDLKAEADGLYTHYLRQAVSLSLAGLGALCLLLAATLSPRRALRVVAPLALAVLTVAAALAAAGERLGILHVVGMLLTIAVGSNYALFFDRLAEHEHAPIPRTLASLAIANLATVAGFGVLAFSGVPVLAALGRTVAPGALLALLYAAWLARLEAPPAAAAEPGPSVPVA